MSKAFAHLTFVFIFVMATVIQYMSFDTWTMAYLIWRLNPLIGFINLSLGLILTVIAYVLAKFMIMLYENKVLII